MGYLVRSPVATQTTVKCDHRRSSQLLVTHNSGVTHYHQSANHNLDNHPSLYRSSQSSQPRQQQHLVSRTDLIGTHYRQNSNSTSTSEESYSTNSSDSMSHASTSTGFSSIRAPSAKMDQQLTPEASETNNHSLNCNTINGISTLRSQLVVLLLHESGKIVHVSGPNFDRDTLNESPLRAVVSPSNGPAKTGARNGRPSLATSPTATSYHPLSTKALPIPSSVNSNITEMFFGSVTVAGAGRDLVMCKHHSLNGGSVQANSWVFAVPTSFQHNSTTSLNATTPASNNIVHRKMAIVCLWDVRNHHKQTQSEMMRDFLFSHSNFIDHHVDQAISGLVENRLKSIQVVRRLVDSTYDLLVECMLSHAAIRIDKVHTTKAQTMRSPIFLSAPALCNEHPSGRVFIDKLMRLLTLYDTKNKMFFFSRLLSAVYLNRHSFDPCFFSSNDHVHSPHNSIAKMIKEKCASLDDMADLLTVIRLLVRHVTFKYIRTELKPRPIAIKKAMSLKPVPNYNQSNYLSTYSHVIYAGNPNYSTNLQYDRNTSTYMTPTRSIASGSITGFRPTHLPLLNPISNPMTSVGADDSSAYGSCPKSSSVCDPYSDSDNGGSRPTSNTRSKAISLHHQLSVMPIMETSLSNPYPPIAIKTQHNDLSPPSSRRAYSPSSPHSASTTTASILVTCQHNHHIRPRKLLYEASDVDSLPSNEYEFSGQSEKTAEDIDEEHPLEYSLTRRHVGDDEYNEAKYLFDDPSLAKATEEYSSYAPQTATRSSVVFYPQLDAQALNSDKRSPNDMESESPDSGSSRSLGPLSEKNVLQSQLYIREYSNMRFAETNSAIRETSSTRKENVYNSVPVFSASNQTADIPLLNSTPSISQHSTAKNGPPTTAAHSISQHFHLTGRTSNEHTSVAYDSAQASPLPQLSSNAPHFNNVNALTQKGATKYGSFANRLFVGVENVLDTFVRNGYANYEEVEIERIDESRIFEGFGQISLVPSTPVLNTLRNEISRTTTAHNNGAIGQRSPSIESDKRNEHNCTECHNCQCKSQLIYHYNHDQTYHQSSEYGTKHVLDSAKCCAAYDTIESFIGDLCESLVQLYTLQAHWKVILEFLHLKLDELANIATDHSTCDMSAQINDEYRLME